MSAIGDPTSKQLAAPCSIDTAVPVPVDKTQKTAERSFCARCNQQFPKEYNWKQHYFWCISDAQLQDLIEQDALEPQPKPIQKLIVPVSGVDYDLSPPVPKSSAPST